MKNLTILIFLLVIWSIPLMAKSYKIEGQITGDEPSMIYLRIGEFWDSTKVSSNKFSFTGDFENPVFASIYATAPEDKNRASTEDFILDQFQKINVEVMDLGKYKLITLITIEGSSLNNDYFNLKRKLSEIDLSIETDYYELFQKFLSKNKNSIACAKLLHDFELKHNHFSSKQLESLLSLINIDIQSPNDMGYLNQTIERNRIFATGENPPIMAFPNENNSSVSTQSLDNKIYIVDFWASYCIPCRDKFPEYNLLHSKYNKKGFDIYYISIDRKRDNWLKAIEKDNAKGIHVLDLNEKESKKFSLSGIPFSYLVGRDGKIVGRNLTHEEIESYLEKNL